MELCSDRYQKGNLNEVKWGKGEFFDARNQLLGMAEVELDKGTAGVLSPRGDVSLWVEPLSSSLVSFSPAVVLRWEGPEGG